MAEIQLSNSSLAAVATSASAVGSTLAGWVILSDLIKVAAIRHQTEKLEMITNYFI